MCTDKNEVSSPTPDFYSIKHVCGVAAKEDRDTGTVDFPGFFLQTEANDDDEPLLIKLTGAIALLLVESDIDKWKKHLKERMGSG